MAEMTNRTMAIPLELLAARQTFLPGYAARSSAGPVAEGRPVAEGSEDSAEGLSFDELFMQEGADEEFPLEFIQPASLGHFLSIVRQLRSYMSEMRSSLQEVDEAWRKISPDPVTGELPEGLA